MTDELKPPADQLPIAQDAPLSETVPGGVPLVNSVNGEAEFGVSAPVEQPAEAGVRLVGWLRRLLSGTPGETRAAELTQMIETYPDTPANYVLRGELLLKDGAYQAAVDDFRHALELASQAVQTAGWGLVAQAVQDRAMAGLRRAERRLQAGGLDQPWSGRPLLDAAADLDDPANAS